MTMLLNHLRNNVVGYVGVFLALSSVAYAAALAPNSVKSKHIKDGQVAAADLGDGAVTGAKVAEDSLGGAEIAEHTLGEVPNATISGHGGYGRQSGGPERGESCNPEDDLWITCAEVALTPSAPGRVFVTGRVRMTIENSNHANGECVLGSSAFGGIPGTTVFHNLTESSAQEWITITGVTDVFAPGNYSFGIDCRETGGGLAIEQARITAVVISPF
jgi:hypothetical protein